MLKIDFRENNAMTDAIRPLIAGNWKMNGLKASSAEFEAMLAGASDVAAKADLLVCPPATLVAGFAEKARGAKTLKQLRLDMAAGFTAFTRQRSALALVSEDPSERGWYHARLVRLDFTRRSAEFLYQSPWQLQGPTADPTGRRVAFINGWSSDRGLVAGSIHCHRFSSPLLRQNAFLAFSGSV